MIIVKFTGECGECGGAFYGGAFYGGAFYGGACYGGAFYGGAFYGGAFYGAVFLFSFHRRRQDRCLQAEMIYLY